MAHTPKSQSRTMALSTDLQKIETFNPSTEESKKIIHNLGKVELLELCDALAETQCPSCAGYWPQGVLYCICGQCLLPSEKQQRMTKKKFDFLVKNPTSSQRMRHLAVQKMECPKNSVIIARQWTLCKMRKGKGFKSILGRIFQTRLLRESGRQMGQLA